SRRAHLKRCAGKHHTLAGPPVPPRWATSRSAPVSAHQELLFIKQTSAILAKHCGKKQAQAILNEAEQRLEAQWADPAFAHRAVAQCSGPGAPEDDLFTELWLELARRRPSLFG